MCLLAICGSSLQKCLLKLFAHFLIRLLVFLLPSCRSSPYILGIEPYQIYDEKGKSKWGRCCSESISNGAIRPLRTGMESDSVTPSCPDDGVHDTCHTLGTPMGQPLLKDKHFFLCQSTALWLFFHKPLTLSFPQKALLVLPKSVSPKLQFLGPQINSSFICCHLFFFFSG